MASSSLLKIGADVEISGRDFVSTPVFARTNQNYCYLVHEEIRIGNMKISLYTIGVLVI